MNSMKFKTPVYACKKLTKIITLQENEKQKIIEITTKKELKKIRF